MKNPLMLFTAGLLSLSTLLVAPRLGSAQMMGQFPNMMMRQSSTSNGMRMTSVGRSGPMNMTNSYGQPYSSPMPDVPYNSINSMPGYGNYQNANYAANSYNMNNNTKKELPHRTGTLRSAPPDAGVLKIALPDESAVIMLEGEPVSSAGQTRFFVTPYLEKGKSVQYEVTAKWTNKGESKKEERKVTVEAGRIIEIDFTKPEKSKGTSVKAEGTKGSY